MDVVPIKDNWRNGKLEGKFVYIYNSFGTFLEYSVFNKLLVKQDKDSAPNKREKVSFKDRKTSDETKNQR